MNHNSNCVAGSLNKVQHELAFRHKRHYLDIDSTHYKPKRIEGVRNDKQLDNVSVVSAVAGLVYWYKQHTDEEAQVNDRIPCGRLHSRHLVKDFHKYLNLNF